MSLLLFSAANAELFVSHSGQDNPNCGSSKSPCATIRYAVSIDKSSSLISVAGDDEPYLDEGGATYIDFTSSIQLIGSGNKSAVIQCRNNSLSKLFHFAPKSANDSVMPVIMIAVTMKVRYFIL